MKILRTALLLAVIMASLAWRPASAAIAFVQQANGNGASGTATASLSATGAHDSLIVLVNTEAAGSSPSCSDGTNTYTNELPITAGAGGSYIGAWIADNIAGGNVTVSCALGSSNQIFIYVIEYEGLLSTGSFDKYATVMAGNFLSSVTTNSVTPSASGELAICFIGDAGYGVSYTFGSPFGAGNGSGSGNSLTAWSEFNGTGASAISCTIALNQATYTASTVLLFKPAAVSPSNPHKSQFFF